MTDTNPATLVRDSDALLDDEVRDYVGVLVERRPFTIEFKAKADSEHIMEGFMSNWPTEDDRWQGLAYEICQRFNKVIRQLAEVSQAEEVQIIVTASPVPKSPPPIPELLPAVVATIPIEDGKIHSRFIKADSKQRNLITPTAGITVMCYPVPKLYDDSDVREFALGIDGEIFKDNGIELAKERAIAKGSKFAHGLGDLTPEYIAASSGEDVKKRHHGTSPSHLAEEALLGGEIAREEIGKVEELAPENAPREPTTFFSSNTPAQGSQSFVNKEVIGTELASGGEQNVTYTETQQAKPESSISGSDRNEGNNQAKFEEAMGLARSAKEYAGAALAALRRGDYAGAAASLAMARSSAAAAMALAAYMGDELAGHLKEEVAHAMGEALLVGQEMQAETSSKLAESDKIRQAISEFKELVEGGEKSIKNEASEANLALQVAAAEEILEQQGDSNEAQAEIQKTAIEVTQAEEERLSKITEEEKEQQIEPRSADVEDGYTNAIVAVEAESSEEQDVKQPIKELQARHAPEPIAKHLQAKVKDKYTEDVIKGRSVVLLADSKNRDNSFAAIDKTREDDERRASEKGAKKTAKNDSTRDDYEKALYPDKKGITQEAGGLKKFADAAEEAALGLAGAISFEEAEAQEEKKPTEKKGGGSGGGGGPSAGEELRLREAAQRIKREPAISIERHAQAVADPGPAKTQKMGVSAPKRTAELNAKLVEKPSSRRSPDTQSARKRATKKAPARDRLAKKRALPSRMSRMKAAPVPLRARAFAKLPGTEPEPE